ncbi:transposase [Virgibacillus sp. 179-BFC.A HS]|uniref:Transposase n=1 Tax=Tigheibacillus jepli TaxID=3035914 RepID=A0ABU5CF32_9BACI|nr:transposase [Virgibacillus sp. 179-BFC.A HS]MDY0404168.1 transposase [Virgibacillus sp. 179-BFC.A HS]
MTTSLLMGVYWLLPTFFTTSAISELASEHGIHTNQLLQWRKVAIKQMSQAFERDTKKMDKMEEDYITCSTRS